jgi:hypothetical protein
VKQLRLPDSKPSSSAILACKLPEIATVKRHVLTLQLHVYFCLVGKIQLPMMILLNEIKTNKVTSQTCRFYEDGQKEIRI